MSGISRITNGMISPVTVIHSIVYPLDLSLTSNRPSLTLTVTSPKELIVAKPSNPLSLSLTNNKPSLELTVTKKKILTIDVCKK